MKARIFWGINVDALTWSACSILQKEMHDQKKNVPVYSASPMIVSCNFFCRSVSDPWGASRSTQNETAYLLASSLIDIIRDLVVGGVSFPRGMWLKNHPKYHWSISSETKQKSEQKTSAWCHLKARLTLLQSYTLLARCFRQLPPIVTWTFWNLSLCSFFFWRSSLRSFVVSGAYHLSLIPMNRSRFEALYTNFREQSHI